MKQRPLGYWLKHLDGAIEDSFVRLLADEGLVRRSWQVLNTLSNGPITVAELDATMAPFLSDAEPTMRPQVDALVARGWADAGGVVTLTAAGRLAHERISSRVYGERARMMKCLKPGEYEALMEVLQRIAHHLEAV